MWFHLILGARAWLSSWLFVNSNYSKPCFIIKMGVYYQTMQLKLKIYKTCKEIRKLWMSTRNELNEHKVLGESSATRTAAQQPEFVYLEDVDLSGMCFNLIIVLPWFTLNFIPSVIPLSTVQLSLSVSEGRFLQDKLCSEYILWVEEWLLIQPLPNIPNHIQSMKVCLPISFNSSTIQNKNYKLNKYLLCWNNQVWFPC